MMITSDLVRDLVAACMAEDGEAWNDLWLIVGEAVDRAIKRAVRNSGQDVSQADDLRQQFFLQLRLHREKLLERFHGTTQGELRSFLRRAAFLFALRHADADARHEARFRRACARLAKSLEADLSEAEYEREVDELLESLPEPLRRDLRRLLSELDDPSLPHSERTLLHLIKKLWDGIDKVLHPHSPRNGS